MDFNFNITKNLKYFFTIIFLVNIYSYSYAKSNDLTFENSITQAIKNSMEIKAERYRLAAIKHSLGESYSSKDWSSSLTTILNSSNKQTGSQSSYVQNEVTTATLSLSKNLLDGGKEYETRIIAKENIKLQTTKVKVVKQNVLLKSIKSYLDIYSSQSVLKLRKTSLDRFREYVDAANLKLAAGTVTPTVVAEAKAKLAKASYELILAEGNRNNAFSSFESITKIKKIPFDLILPKIKFDFPKTKKEVVKISSLNNPLIIIAQLTKSIAQKNIELKKTDNRASLNLRFELKDNQSTAISSSTDYNTYGAYLTFSSPLFYNNSSTSSLYRLEKLALASSIDLAEKYREVELSAISSLQSYKTSIAKTFALQSQKNSSLLALNGIKKEAKYGIRTILDVLDAEVDFLNASANLIKSQTEQIYNLFSIKAILGDLSIQDINSNYKIDNKIKEKNTKFNVLNSKIFN